ncbi:serine-rich adhesin for platelets, partial [Biomphalaria pfeifferi]
YESTISPSSSDAPTRPNSVELKTTSPLLTLLTSTLTSVTTPQKEVMTDQPTTTTSHASKTDIILLIDASTSAGLESWSNLTTFASNFVRSLTFDNTLFGAVVFNKRSKILFSMDTYTSIDEVSE